jgi:type 1 glutamine amidotransferase
VKKLFLFLCCAIASSLAFAAPKKIVLIAGPLDDHPPGTHEYENNVLVLKHCLEHSANLFDVVAEVHFGWPKDAATLNEADSIVLTSGGSDRNETDHPLYVADHFAQLEKQMKRGCGVVMFHWSVFHPARHHEKIIEWLGGYFDYETGTNGPTKKWFSKIEHATWPVIPAAPEHPLLRGIKPFELKDEFYFNIHFRGNDPRFTPILFKQAPQEENIIAWAVERENGGRGFGFTCGHFYTNWWQPEFRKLILNAIVWTAKLEVPSTGVESSLEKFQIPISRKVKKDPTIASAKKLKPATVTDSGGIAKEEEWKDSRWNQMDTGQFLGSTLRTSNSTVAKGLSIRLGEHDEAAVVYDTVLCNVRAAWTGKFLTFDPTRYGLINAPTIAGDIQFVSPSRSAWNGSPRYTGLFLNGKRVVLSYAVGEVAVLESSWLESDNDTKIFTRTFQLSASREGQTLLLAEIKGANPQTNEIDGIQIASLKTEGNHLAAAVGGNAKARLSTQSGQIILEIPPRSTNKVVQSFSFERG